MDRGGQDCSVSHGATGTIWVDTELGTAAWGAGRGSRDSSANQIIMKVFFLIKILHVLVFAGGGKHPSVSPQESHGPALGGWTVRPG